MIVGLVSVCGAMMCTGQTPRQTSVSSSGNSAQSDPAPKSPTAGGPQLPNQQASGNITSGSISGTIVDESGAVVAGARVELTGENRPPNHEVLTGGDGQFFFVNVSSGGFQLTVTAAGFAAQISSGMLRVGETQTVPQIALSIAANVTDVQVSLSPAEVAEAQVKDEEKQRVFGVIPNFYVTYDPHPLALTAKQKYELAWKTTIDPVTFAIIGGIAGVQQAQNTFSGYGQGAQGYAKRYGAAFADVAAGTFIGSAVLPSLLKQDPRYFYKGTGSKPSRIQYAIVNSVICKGDNGRWQPNYSNILGNLAAGGVSNLYYPAQNRNGAELTFENAAIGIGATAAANLVEEFLMRKLTSNIPHDRAEP
jgi:Carboxypeptidase regulatory-like domain